MKKFRKVSGEIEINSSKEKVWDLLFNRFGEVNLFNPVIEGSHHTNGKKGEVGCERQCDLDSKTSIREKITAARGNDSFDIDVIEGGLLMMDKMKGTIELNSLHENRTKVTFVMNYNTSPVFMGAIIKGMISKMIYKVLLGLKYYLETGNPVTKENIKSIQMQFDKLEANASFGLTADIAFAD